MYLLELVGKRNFCPVRNSDNLMFVFILNWDENQNIRNSRGTKVQKKIDSMMLKQNVLKFWIKTRIFCFETLKVLTLQKVNLKHLI